MRLRRKLKNRKGFTLAETLLAVLILLLVSAIVANGIPVARNVYQRVVLAANAQDMMATAVSALRDELGTAWDVRVENVEKKKYLTYFSSGTGARSKIFLSNDTDAQIMLQENTAVTDLGVADNDKSTARVLVADKEKQESSSRLYVSYRDVAYSNGKVTFTNLQAGTAENRDMATVDSLVIDVFSDDGNA
ncbi:MAG: prepilin-type N-terminal cleavage/methylation domain-containing protein [Clostridia bacterium]|nr:prepilin-type N-terminal cleavage/methylation domain-containing protein [Clostridia bacterium]